MNICVIKKSELIPLINWLHLASKQYPIISLHVLIKKINGIGYQLTKDDKICEGIYFDKMINGIEYTDTVH